MNFIMKTNKTLERLLPILTPISVVLGVVFSKYLHSLVFLIPWIFALMTFSSSINSTFTSIKKSIARPFPILVSIFCLHIIMPLLAWLVGNITFPNDQLTTTGLILAVVIPTGVTSVIWVAMKNGNVVLTLSVILIDTLLSPFVIPLSLVLFVGSNIEMNVLSIMSGLFLMIVIPSILGTLANHFMKGAYKDTIKRFLSPGSKLGIIAVVMINGADIAPNLREVNFELVKIAIVVFFIACSGYIFAWIVGKLLKFKFEDLVALVFSSGMRNIGSGIVIATSFFPSKVAVPVVLGMLFQQMLASFYAGLLSKLGIIKKINVNKTFE